MTVYTHGHHETVLAAHATRTATTSAAYLVPHLRPGQRLLDVGCGPGSITADLAAAVAPGRVTAIEPAPGGVLDAAASLAADRGLTTVDVEVADVNRLPYAAATFDVVHAHQVLQHLSDPVGALAEMARVCQPGGLVAARDADYAAMTWYPVAPALERWLEVYRAVCRHNDAEPDAGRRLTAWARAAGLTDVTPSASVWLYATPAERQWWAESSASRFESAALGDQAVAYGLTTRSEIADIAAGWRAWAAEPDGWFAILHGEILARA